MPIFSFPPLRSFSPPPLHCHSSSWITVHLSLSLTLSLPPPSHLLKFSCFRFLFGGSSIQSGLQCLPSDRCFNRCAEHAPISHWCYLWMQLPALDALPLASRLVQLIAENGFSAFKWAQTATKRICCVWAAYLAAPIQSIESVIHNRSTHLSSESVSHSIVSPVSAPLLARVNHPSRGALCSWECAPSTVALPRLNTYTHFTHSNMHHLNVRVLHAFAQYMNIIHFIHFSLSFSLFFDSFALPSSAPPFEPLGVHLLSHPCNSFPIPWVLRLFMRFHPLKSIANSSGQNSKQCWSHILIASPSIIDNQKWMLILISNGSTDSSHLKRFSTGKHFTLSMRNTFLIPRFPTQNCSKFCSSSRGFESVAPLLSE